MIANGCCGLSGFLNSHETGNHSSSQRLGSRFCSSDEWCYQDDERRHHCSSGWRYVYSTTLKTTYWSLDLCLNAFRFYVISCYHFCYNKQFKYKELLVKFIYFTGVYIYGLFLDGAGWDRRNTRLMEPQAKVLFTLLPVVHVYAINYERPKSNNLYECPVYKKPNRTDLTYIFPLLLKTSKDPDHWILRGVALLCDIK